MFVGFQRHQCPPTTPQYLTILMIERRGAIFFVGFWRPPPDVTILMTERGRHYVCRISAPPMLPPPTAPQYLTILMTERERRGVILFCRILAPPTSPQTSQYLTIFMTGRGGERQLQYPVRSIIYT